MPLFALTRSRLAPLVFWVAWLAPALAAVAQTAPRLIDGLRVEKVLDDLDHPWSLAFLPRVPGQAPQALVVQRNAGLLLVDAPTQGPWRAVRPVDVPGARVAVQGQGGWFDVALHPDFARQPWVYVSLNGVDGRGRMGTELWRARWNGQSLTQATPLFALQPKSRAVHHFGGRIVLDGQGHVFLTLGDRGDMARAQRPDDHAGSVVRLTEDGQVPPGNPWVGQAVWLPEQYSKGHRNIQGAALHPTTRQLWTHEHGPQGGDEINIVRPGLNHGWPTITHGVNYGTGTSIGVGTHQAGMEQPLHTWVPSIAPSGMAFVPPDSQTFTAWRGQLLVGALRDQMLVRLELDGERVVREHRLLSRALGRIRDVRMGPDGLIYLLTDANPGAVYRLSPG
ncbi:MAG: glucose dehydrogenase [Polaromonas sp.]|nr:glucose dehydrogenase [Polaromonas sp.]